MNRGQKTRARRREPPRKGLVEGLWEQYAPVRGNNMQNGGEKFWKAGMVEWVGLCGWVGVGRGQSSCQHVNRSR